MACAAEYGRRRHRLTKSSARDDPPVRRPGPPGNLCLQKALQVRCAVWSRAPDERQPAYMAEVVVFGVVATDVVACSAHPHPGRSRQCRGAGLAHRRKLGQRGLRAQLGWAPRTPRRPSRQRRDGRASPGRTRPVRRRYRVHVPCRCRVPAHPHPARRYWRAYDHRGG